jgi:ribbon-helix-helix CopG family protein
MTDKREDDWETEESEAVKPVGVVVSARLPADLAERVFEVAQRRGVPTSAILREAIEDLLAQPRAAASTVDITISSANVPVSLYTGRSTLGRTGSGPSSIELDAHGDQLVLSR